MGHDHHFLERLDRASRAEADFALSLYRDDAALRYVLESARLPADAERIALEIAPGGPHVIVRRQGQFVTCLGRGMSVGPHPIVSRARIDALLATVADLRERRKMAKLVERPGEDEGDVFARLVNRADNISREEFVAISGWQPVCAPTWYRMAWDNTASAVKWSIERTSRGPAGDGGSREAAYARWKLVWSIGHHWLLATMGSRDYLLEHTARFGSATKLAFTSCLSPLGSTRLSMRGWWGAARIGKPLVAVYKQRIAAPDNALDLLDAMIALAAIGLRHAALRAELRKVVLSPRTYGDESTTTTAASVAGALQGAFDDPDAVARGFLEWGREHYMERSAGLPEGSPLRFANAVDVPDDLARSALLGLDLNLFDQTSDAASLAVQSVSTIAAARAEDFYLPREVESALRVPWTPERTGELLGRALRSCVKQEPRRAAPSPGRNEPCTCGSGKKYKKCCGA